MLKNILKKGVYSIFLLPAIAFAAATVGSPTPPMGASRITYPGELTGPISNIIAFLGSLTLAIAVIFFMYAGFLYVTAGDDEKKIESAKYILIYGVIGVAVAVAAGGIPLFIKNTVG